MNHTFVIWLQMKISIIQYEPNIHTPKYLLLVVDNQTVVIWALNDF